MTRRESGLQAFHAEIAEGKRERAEIGFQKKRISARSAPSARSA